MTVIIDYGLGNLFSLKSSLAYIGAEALASSEPDTIKNADRIILPGVGAFSDAAACLRESGLAGLIKAEAKKGKPLLGICLGMQLLFDRSYEHGLSEGLGILSGEIRKIDGIIPNRYKIPHIGWNSLNFTECGRGSKILKHVSEADYVYFVHSYAATDCSDSIIAVTDYGAPLTAAVERGNIFGCQFHPEKSGETGLGILKAFCEL